MGDFNEDGQPDIAVASIGLPGIDILLASDAGGFEPVRSYATTKQPLDVVAIDLNADGHLDLVAAGGGVAVLWGPGDGTFGPPVSYPVAGSPAALVADAFGDGGAVDIAVASSGPIDVVPTNGAVDVLVSDGGGILSLQQTISVGALQTAIAAADLNGDGRQDLVVANAADDTVSVLLGLGNGQFGQQATFAVGDYPVALSLADVNGNSKPDLLVANLGDQTLGLLPGTGTGTLQPMAVLASFDGGPSATSVGDLNGDGVPDVAVAVSYAQLVPGSVECLLGTGDGGFALGKSLTAGIEPAALQIADLNNDGLPDIVVANRYDGTISIFLGACEQ